MGTVYSDTVDDGTYTPKTMWVALVVKDKLKLPDNKVQYVATTTASTQTIAVSNIAKKQWGDHYWVEGKSTTRILAIFRADNPRIFAGNTAPTRRRRSK